MSVKAELETVVRLQARELDLGRIDQALNEISSERAKLDAEVEAAGRHVEEAEADLLECQRQDRHLEMELKAAEDKLDKYKDQLLEVKTNKELWALQEEISRAEEAVDSYEEKSIEELERVDELEKEIVERRRKLEEVTNRVKAARAEADVNEQELYGRRQRVEEAIEELRGRLPETLLGKYEDVKEVRGGLAVTEARQGTCQACNFKLRPQLYVEVRNLSDILQCENCNRILFSRDDLDVAESLISEDASRGVGQGP